MDNISKPEQVTQDRVIALLRDNLGYEYLGDKTGCNNNNIEEYLLTKALQKRSYTNNEISQALEELSRAANTNNGLYEANKKIYQLLRYGAKVQRAKSKRIQSVHFIDWQIPQNNHFAVAEEVTLRGNNERRPDIVLYVNGIALAVLELKNSRVSVNEGIRQNISNQQEEFNEWFFTTVQFLFAGNDSEGMRYGPIGTQDKNYLRWKEEDATEEHPYLLDKHLTQMCEKSRFLDLIYDFVVFDGGVKKLPRPHQYFAVKKAQKRISRRTGGIIWHTQGSGKSYVMILLARWILENISSARVITIVDRLDLEAQIGNMFKDAGQSLARVESGVDLLDKLKMPSPRLLCTLLHKFSNKDSETDFMHEIQEWPETLPSVVGDIFVFVDECHRSHSTESGKMHKKMKIMLPHAVFIGFTGTPLLREHKQMSTDIFGSYIHTYKYSEAVGDGVVLDLMYEARSIEQRLSSEEKVDQWFAAKTRGLNEWGKKALQEKWATMQNVLSSKNRIEHIANDILLDFSTRLRLANERGTAMLIAGSIFEACKYYRAFEKTPMRGKCAMITSYTPHQSNVSREDTGANSDTDRTFINNAHKDMLQEFNVSNMEMCEKIVKKRFIEEPARLRLLIVVDKLLTGFDAPSCTYLYIDKSMQDHGLFQAICRTNRLDGEDKEHGVIVDYKDLFHNLQGAIEVYTSGLHQSENGGSDPQIRIHERLRKCRERLEQARDNMYLILENIPPPKGDVEYIKYFCGDSEKTDNLKENETKRIDLYKAATALLRAYANIVDDIAAAGYENQEIANIKSEVENATNVRQIVRLASGEYLDTKSYESDMRHMIDSYIAAEESQKISMFDKPLVDLITNLNITNAIKKLSQMVGGKNEKVQADVIVNNIRSTIKQMRLTSPEFYDRMSCQLNEILRLLREQQIDYATFLSRVDKLVKRVQSGQDDNAPDKIQTRGQRAIYEVVLPNCKNPDDAANLSLLIDDAVKNKASAYWRDSSPKERQLKGVLAQLVDESLVESLFDIIEQHDNGY